MAKRKIVWTETAAKQRREILKYWTERNESTIYAKKLIEITAKHLKVISKNPEAFKETEIDDESPNVIDEIIRFYCITFLKVYPSITIM